MISEVYNIDCMEYMRHLPDKHFDLAIADPPYGISIDRASLCEGLGLSKQNNTQARQGRGKEIFAFCGRFRKVKTNYGWKYQLVMFEVCELDDVYQSENGMVEFIHDRPIKIDRNTYEAIRKESLKCKKIMDLHRVSMEAIYTKFNK